MRKFTFLLLVIVSLLLTSCISTGFGNKIIKASGPDVICTIDVPTVTQIDACQAIVVNYTQGSPVAVKYTAPESLAKFLKITCVNGKLICKYDEGISPKLDNRSVIIDVTAPNVNEFDVSSAAQINVRDTLSIDEIEIDASSASIINIASLNAKKIDIESSSAGSVIIKELNSNSVEIEGSSSGSVNIGGTMATVEVDASSAAIITIDGECKFININASSGASVNAASAMVSTGSLNASSGASINAPHPIESPYQISKSSGGTISMP